MAAYCLAVTAEACRKSVIKKGPTTMKRFLLTALLASSLSTTQAAQYIGPAQVLVSGARSLYSPEIKTFYGVKRMWSGGWRTESDVGTDKIFVSVSQGSGWSYPQPTLTKPGYSYNDPTVVQHAWYPWLFMYYTSLSHVYAGSYQAMTSNNTVGLAVSTDYGNSWIDLGEIIGRLEGGCRWNGYDCNGAWSPSAIVVGSEIWLYYHGNAPSTATYRTRLNMNGWQIIETSPVNLPAGPQRINVDVSVQGNKFVMLANEGGLGTVSRYVSWDGFNWFANESNPIINFGNAYMLITPHSTAVPGSATDYDISFGFAVGNGPSNSMHSWRFRSY